MKKETLILRLLKERSEQALEEIDQAFGKRCLQLAKRILHNDQDAEECVNDAYLRLWRLSPARLPSSLEPYLMQTIRNLCINRIKQKAAMRDGHTEEDIPLHELDYCLSDMTLPENENELRPLINRFLSTLDRRDMLLFVRRYWYSDSIEVLSVASGLSPNYVYQRLYRIRKKLRKYLIERGISL